MTARSCRDWPSSAPAALRDALDELFRRFVRRPLLVTGTVAAQDIDHLVDDGDRENRKARHETQLRNPERERDDPLRNVVEAPGIVRLLRRMPGEVQNE